MKTKMTQTNAQIQFAGWRAELLAEIIKAVKRLRQGGTMAMSRDNLWQVTRVPNNGGPAGTNCASVARQIFDEIIENNRSLKTFASL